MAHALVIEDDILIAMRIEEMLLDLGIDTIAIAATENEAVRSALARQPDLITSDVRLEPGHGPRAVAEILKSIGATPVIFITGSPDECEPCIPPAIVLEKPVMATTFADAYHRLM